MLMMAIGEIVVGGIFVAFHYDEQRPFFFVVIWTQVDWADDKDDVVL